ncbi:DUF3347 domain-containing protein [Limibacter armeniacum]|uniref:DUF3347 domain-containing protein n=1 Tax=Limibacter armeniacum TaxID=466084 RepID=UPI002FE6587C
MKLNRLFKLLLPGIVVLLGFTACGSESKDTHHEGHDHQHETVPAQAEDIAETPVAKISNEQVQVLLDGYLPIKDALVKTDAKAAQKAASEFAEKLSEEAFAAIKDVAGQVAATDDVEAQRTSFEVLSEKVYEVVKTADVTAPIYKQYCPMAFDNKGAFWLSSEKEIRNPYFGDKMLTCGMVKETIAKQ